MRVLHTYANWKWTGPAELALNACLGQRAAGVDARFACGRPPADAPPERTIRWRARQRGLEPALEELWLTKHRRPLKGILDVRRLGAYLGREQIAILHAHQPNDHGIALRAARSHPHVRVVRSYYDALFPEGRRERRLLQATHAIACASRSVLDEATGTLAFPRAHAAHVETAVDIARFDPDRSELPDMRAAWSIPGDAYVVGIVARMQLHRRFEVLIEALARAHQELPGNLRGALIGRGTHEREVAREPVRKRGLANVVTLPGYVDGDAYVGALRALDVKVFLVPGSDASCRAVREALAMGRPVIAARRGMLPEIVRHGETGLVVDDTPEELARAIVALGRDAALRERLGAAAREDARARFSVEAATAALLGLYERAAPSSGP